jgi:hypothetical protein
LRLGLISLIHKGLASFFAVAASRLIGQRFGLLSFISVPLCPPISRNSVRPPRGQLLVSLERKRKACRHGRLFCFYSLLSEYQIGGINAPSLMGDFGVEVYWNQRYYFEFEARCLTNFHESWEAGSWEPGAGSW